MSEENIEQKKKDYKISFDVSQTVALARENEALKIAQARKENENLSERKIQVFKEFGKAECLDCQTNEELKNFVTELVKSASHKEASGSAPLNEAQYGNSGQSLYERKFANEKEMVDGILDQMHNGTTEQARNEAKSYYNALLKKWVQTRKRDRNAPEGFYDPNAPENMPDLKDEGGFRVPVRKEEGDIAKILLAWKNERERKMKEGSEK